MFQTNRKLLHEGAGILFSSQFFRLHLQCFCGAAVPCCALSFVQQYIQQAYQKRKKGLLPDLGYVYVGRDVRPATARDAKRMWRPSCFLLKHDGRIDSWHYQVASLQLRANMEKLYSIMDLCPLGIVIWCIFLPERA